jgi:dTMP kinase
MDSHFFIVFEGIDGSGKDTQLMALANAIKNDLDLPFANKYANLWLTREPTIITESGREVSRLLRDDYISGESAVKYFVEDRLEHSKIIRSQLAHSHVLSSRYDLSTFTYQMTQGEPFESIYERHGFENGMCIVPDVTIVFDIPVDVALERINKQRSKKEVYEKKEFLNKAREEQFRCIERLRELGRTILVIDGDGSADEVTERMLHSLHHWYQHSR